jgi:hypothetical protein
MSALVGLQISKSSDRWFISNRCTNCPTRDSCRSVKGGHVTEREEVGCDESLELWIPWSERVRWAGNDWVRKRWRVREVCGWSVDGGEPAASCFSMASPSLSSSRGFVSDWLCSKSRTNVSLMVVLVAIAVFSPAALSPLPFVTLLSLPFWVFGGVSMSALLQMGSWWLIEVFVGKERGCRV